MKIPKLERLADSEELDKDIEARHCMFALKNEDFEQCANINCYLYVFEAMSTVLRPF